MLIITLKNYEKYAHKGRKDIKNPVWMPLNNRILEDEDIYSLTAGEFKAFVYILCQSSIQQRGKVHINIAKSRNAANVSTEDLFSCCYKLLDLGVILEIRTDCVRDPYATLHYNTLHNTTKHLTSDDQKSFNLPKELAEEKVATEESVAGQKNKELQKRIWNSYRDAFILRWKVEPPTNAKSNSIVMNLRKRLGEDAVEVVKFFIAHNDSLYLRQMHSIGLCLRDAEALYTQWQRGKAITGRDVRNFEKKLDEVEQPKSDDHIAREITAKIQSAISKYGHSNASEAKKFLGDEVWSYVHKIGGWSFLCRNLGASLSFGSFASQMRELLKAGFKTQGPLLETKHVLQLTNQQGDYDGGEEEGY